MPPVRGSVPGALRAFDGGERVVVFPHGQRQRASGLGLEQVVAAAEAGLLGDPGAVAGDVVRIEVRRGGGCVRRGGRSSETPFGDWASVVCPRRRPRRASALYRSLYSVGPGCRPACTGGEWSVDVLIERESELAVLGEVVAAAAAGRGGAVLIEGEAGHRQDAVAAARARPRGRRPERVSCTPPLTRSRRTCRSPARASCSPRAARGMAPDGPARLGLLALDGALADPSGPGSRSDEVVHALWWLIVELADDRPLALFLDDAQWADELTLQPAAAGGAARASSCRSRSSSPPGRRRPVSGTPGWPPSARSCGSSRRRSRWPAPRDSSRRCSLGPGSVEARRSRARGDRRQPALSPGVVAAGPRRRRRPHERRPPAAAARAARRRPARAAHARRGRPRARRRRPGAGRRPDPGARARRTRGERGDRRRGGAARRAGARRRARTPSRTRWSPRRRGRAIGAADAARAARARGRAARRRRRGRPARRRAPVARPAAR